MSNLFAIGQVTEALRLLLHDSLKSEVNGLKVVAGKPPATPPDSNIPTIVVFCYQVTPNGAMRSADAPTRDGAGTVIRTPSAACDLHYLISCYGNEVTVVPQILLGGVVRTLHVQPLLSKKNLEDAATGGLLKADLASSEHRVRFTPTKLDLDDLSKLWSMLINTPFAPSVAYEASLVFIDGKDTPTAGLPVKTRNVGISPGRRPSIARVLTRPNGAPTPAVEGPVPLGNEVVIEGGSFLGDATTVVIGDREVTPREPVEDSRLIVVPPNDLRVGVLPIRVVRQVLLDESTSPPTTRPLESAAKALGRQALVTAATLGPGPRVTVVTDLAIADDQRVYLLLDAASGRSYRFAAPVPMTGRPNPTTVIVETSGVVPSTYRVRLDVDDLASPVDPGRTVTFT